MIDIKIFVAHKNDHSQVMVDSPIYVNVHEGAYLSPYKESKILRDDVGEHISDKHLNYGALTVQYWAWKNIDAEYYGLYSGNDYLLLHSDLSSTYRKNINVGLKAVFNEDNVRKYQLDNEMGNCSIICANDFITGKAQTIKCFKNLEEAMRADEQGLEFYAIEMCLQILKEKNPKMFLYAQKYLQQDSEYICGSFIMRKELFHEFCELEFYVLAELEKIIDISKYTSEKINVFEKIGKFLLGVYTFYQLREPKIKVRCSHFVCFDEETRQTNLSPAFEVRNITVILSSSDYFAPYLGVCIKSIALTASKDNNYDIIVIERGIAEKNKTRIEGIVADYKNISIRFLNVEKLIKDADFYINSDRISQETYYGLLTPWFLPNYHKAIIMDCDMIVKTDIADLYNIQLGDNIGGGINDIVLQGWLNDPKNDTYSYYINDLHILNPFKCFNGGLILLDFEKYRNTFTWQMVMNYINKYKLRVVDQDIFNILLEGRAKLLDVRWNHMIYLKGAISSAIESAPATAQKMYYESQKSPFIIHYASENKPWLNPEIEFGDEFWAIARQTVFYEMIFARMVDKKIGAIQHSAFLQGASIDSVDNRSGARRLADRILPHGTFRRNFTKKILPKGSLRWKFCKRIYFIFHPEYRVKK